MSELLMSVRTVHKETKNVSVHYQQTSATSVTQATLINVIMQTIISENVNFIKTTNHSMQWKQEIIPASEIGCLKLQRENCMPSVDS